MTLLADYAENYIKTVVAFANGNGGKIVVGIDDKTKKIVGVDDEKVFQIMDAVANTVSDMVEPQIAPNIMLETVNGKSLVVIEIEAGENRPYYIKAEGRDRGTYIRVGATSRPADSMQIKELEIEGKNLSWDNLRCVGCSVDVAAVEKLCADINKYREKLAHGNESKVGVKQLMSWDILLADEKSPVATNAFALLTGEKFDYAKVQCARFKGKDRSVFIARNDFPRFDVEGRTGRILQNAQQSDCESVSSYGSDRRMGNGFGTHLAPSGKLSFESPRIYGNGHGVPRQSVPHARVKKFGKRFGKKFGENHRCHTAKSVRND